MSRLTSAVRLAALVLAAAIPLGPQPGAQAALPRGDGDPAAAPSAGPNDPLYSQQAWYLDRIVHAFDTWPRTEPLAPVQVAVVDSGIAGSQPDLAGRVVAARSFVGGSAFVDRNGHGTFVAGEIAAIADNGVGVAGVAPNVELIVAKVADRKGRVHPEDEAAAIRWAVDAGADVINLSLSVARDPARPSWNRSRAEAEAVRYALRKGVVVVAAAGNCPTRAPCPAGYPAALPGVIGVGALNPNLKPASFTPRDAEGVDIVAPGVGIVSTTPRGLARQGCRPAWYSICARGLLAYGAGTSFAAPLVSATAALVLARRGVAAGADGPPGPGEIRALLAEGATPPPTDNPKYGAGILNVAGTLEAASLP